MTIRIYYKLSLFDSINHTMPLDKTINKAISIMTNKPIKYFMILLSSLFLKNIIIRPINNVIIIPNDKFIFKIKSPVKFFEFN